MEILKSHCFGVGKKPQDGAQRQTRRMFSSTTELKRDCLPIPTSLAGIHHVEVNETLMSPVGRHAPHRQDPPALEKGGLWSPGESYSFLSVCCLSIGCAVCPARFHNCSFWLCGCFPWSIPTMAPLWKTFFFSLQQPTPAFELC